MRRWEYEEGRELPDLRQLKQLTRFMPAVIIIVIVLLAALTSYYTVEQDELAVVTRFGKFNRVTEPGLHFKLPFGIEKIQKPRVQHIFKEEFGFRTVKAGVRSVYEDREFLDESLMLCGDLSCAVVEWVVQYKIKDPKAYLFNVRDPKKTIRDVSEAALRNIAGDSSVDEILTIRRIEINKEAQEMMQKILDSYGLGVQIVTVKLQDVNPPEEVKPAFNEVNEAKQDRERFINEAWQEYNREVPKAKGEAKKMVQIAEAYAVERVNKAKGEAQRFLSILEEYKKAKEVTRRRIYLETMNEILPKIGRTIIIDESQTGVLPLLPLEELPKFGGKK